MRRVLLGLLCLVLTLGLAMPAAAANAATRADMAAAVAEDGSCQIRLTVQLQLDFLPSELYFPLPEDARSITVNGESPRTSRGGGITMVDVSEYITREGAVFLEMEYTLPNVVGRNDLGNVQIDLPLLSGFGFPVDQLLFHISLPGECTNNPAFFSGYYKQSIEASMQWDLLGSVVSGSVNTQLKDRETLAMTLEVPDTMFPQVEATGIASGFEDTVAWIVGALALLYWILFLRCAPLLRRRTTTAPAGMTAGQLGSGLLGIGADLTMLVFSWAQLGYILIHTNDHGRIMLHKRMEMGNERSAFEVRAFRELFGKRVSLDATGLLYANRSREFAGRPDLKENLRKGSGNPRIFRGLCAVIGGCFGLSLGVALAGDAVLGILLTVLLVILCALCSWFLQAWILGVLLHYRRKVVIAGCIAAAWLLLGFLGGIGTKALVMLCVQLLAGALCFLGGRRTQIGRQNASQILGLRRYLCKVPPRELHRISDSDPYYFFTMAPYALALGVEKSFARRFGARRLPACPWLTSGMDGHMTALEWSDYMRRTVDAMDSRQKQLFWERLRGK